MGILNPCLVTQCKDSIEELNNNNNTSLASQPSLPSIPSLQLHRISGNGNVIVASVTTLAAHSSYISSLFLAGKFLFTATSDGAVHVYNHAGSGGTLVATTNSPIKSIAVSGDKLFTAHHDHKVRVWDIEIRIVDDDVIANSGACRRVATLPTLSDRVSRMFSSSNYVEVRRHKRRTFVHHNDAVSALAVSPDGTTLLTASWDRTFKVWRASSSGFRCVESVSSAHDDAVNAIALTADGNVYTGSADRKIKVWREGQSGNYELVGTLEKHRSAVNALAVSTDGRVLYSGACDRSILVWEKDNNMMNSENNENEKSEYMVVVGALRGHSKAILSLAIMGDLVCSGSADCSIRVWKRVGFNNKSYACLAVLESHTRPVKCLTIALDNNSSSSSSNSSNENVCCTTNYLVYSGGLDCEVKLWKITVP